MWCAHAAETVLAVAQGRGTARWLATPGRCSTFKEQGAHAGMFDPLA
jgi:hypothetical protein